MTKSLHLAFPFGLRNGVEIHVDREAYVEQLIETILFTNKGERVNLPAFGCGVQQLVFLAADSALVPATLFMIKSELQRFVGAHAIIQDLTVAFDDARLFIDVHYRMVDSPDTRLVRYAQEGQR